MKKSYIIGVVIISLCIVGALTVTNKKEQKTSGLQKDISTSDINMRNISKEMIERLKKEKANRINENRYLKYEEVIEMLGKGEVVYPEPDDKNLKVTYWTYEENGYRYFFDAIFFMDNLVNVESRLMELPEKFDDAYIENYYDKEAHITDIKSLRELEEAVGDGVVAMKYHFDTEDTIYAWSHDDGFMVAYIINGDEILYIRTADSLEKLVVSSTNCH